jgi:hypothetical protein
MIEKGAAVNAKEKVRHTYSASRGDIEMDMFY